MDRRQIQSALAPMANHRRYSRYWLEGLKGLSQTVDELGGRAGDWIPSTLVWTAVFKCLLQGRAIPSGEQAARIQIGTVVSSLRILNSARTLGEAIELMGKIARLANLPSQFILDMSGEVANLNYRITDQNVANIVEIEILHLTLVISVMQWLVDQHIPIDHIVCRSQRFIENHRTHPDFDCGLISGTRVSCRFDAAWLREPIADHRSSETLEEVLVWLVYDNPADLILPENDIIGGEEMKVDASVDDIPMYKYVGARQKRRKLIAQHGVTLRGFKNKYLIRRAKFLMVEGRLTVEQIASELGYTDAGSFRRLFKRLVGSSPGEFRSSKEYAELSALCRLIQLSRDAAATGQLH